MEEDDFFPGVLQRILVLREELKSLEGFVQRKIKQNPDMCLVICAIAETPERTYKQIASRTNLDEALVRMLCLSLAQEKPGQKARAIIMGDPESENATVQLNEEGRGIHREMFRVT